MFIGGINHQFNGWFMALLYPHYSDIWIHFEIFPMTGPREGLDQGGAPELELELRSGWRASFSTEEMISIYSTHTHVYIYVYNIVYIYNVLYI